MALFAITPSSAVGKGKIQWQANEKSSGQANESFRLYVTVPDKRDHFQQYFKIELLVLKGRVALKQ